MKSALQVVNADPFNSAVHHLPKHLRWNVTTKRQVVFNPDSEIISRKGLRLGRLGHRYQLEFGNGLCVELNPDNSSLTIPEGSLEKSRDCEEQIQGALLGVWLYAKGALVLHGAGIVSPRGVIGILGPSQSGKSTTAWIAHQHGRTVWADDLLTIIRHQGELRTLPGHPLLRLRMRNNAKRKKVRLNQPRFGIRKILRLVTIRRSPGQQWGLATLKGSTRLTEILKHVYTARISQGAPTAWHQIVMDLASSVEIAVLRVPNSIASLKHYWPVIWQELSKASVDN